MATVTYKTHLEASFARVKPPVRYWYPISNTDIYTTILMLFAKRLNSPFPQLTLSNYHPWGNDYSCHLLSTLVLDCSFHGYRHGSLSSSDAGVKSGRYFMPNKRTWGLRTALLKKWCWSCGRAALCMKEKALRIWSDFNDQPFESRDSGQPLCQCNPCQFGNLGKCFLVLTALIGGLFCAKRRRWFNHWCLMAFWLPGTVPSQVRLSVSLNNWTLPMAFWLVEIVFLDLWMEKKKSTKEKWRWSIMNWSMEKWSKPIKENQQMGLNTTSK